MEICQSCYKPTLATIMSMFNTKIICPKCSDTERKRPDFEEAREAEGAAVLKGDYNFKGIGYK